MSAETHVIWVTFFRFFLDSGRRLKALFIRFNTPVLGLKPPRVEVSVEN